MRGVAPSLLLIALAGCNQYEMFRLTGFEQDSFSNKADILFVVDNSDSMVENASSLAVNFGGFIDKIAARQNELATEDLNDAVDNYTTYTTDRAAYMNFQFGITTTDVDATYGELYGKPKPKLINRDDEDVAGEFNKALLCEATCFRDVASDPGYDCGDPLVEVSSQYLNCVCGAGKWEEQCGSGREEGVEAVFMAMCRAVPNPPSVCFEEFTIGDEDFPALFSDADILTNEGLMRDRATFMPIIVTDEGDDSRRMSRADPIPDYYESLFQMFGVHMSWVVIGPTLDDNFELDCPGTATDWGTVRYEYFVQNTNGLKINIQDPNCNPAGFGPALDKLGVLLQSLLSSFALQSVPQEDTIMVFVDGEEVPRAEVVRTDDFGLDAYDSGWVYRPDDNSIAFHGDAIPPNDADVKVYYEPLDGMPRDLPF